MMCCKLPLYCAHIWTARHDCMWDWPRVQELYTEPQIWSFCFTKPTTDPCLIQNPSCTFIKCCSQGKTHQTLSTFCYSWLTFSMLNFGLHKATLGPTEGHLQPTFWYMPSVRPSYHTSHGWLWQLKVGHRWLANRASWELNEHSSNRGHIT